MAPAYICAPLVSNLDQDPVKMSLLVFLQVCVHTHTQTHTHTGFPGGSVIKKSAWQCSRLGLYLWVEKIPWSWKWQPTPLFLPGQSHGQRSSASYSPWGYKRIGHN